MRSAFLLVATSLLFISVPASACGGEGTAPNDGGYRYCHDHTLHVGNKSDGVHTTPADSSSSPQAPSDGTSSRTPPILPST